MEIHSDFGRLASSSGQEPFALLLSNGEVLDDQTQTGDRLVDTMVLMSQLPPSDYAYIAAFLQAVMAIFHLRSKSDESEPSIAAVLRRLIDSTMRKEPMGEDHILKYLATGEVDWDAIPEYRTASGSGSQRAEDGEINGDADNRDGDRGVDVNARKRAISNASQEAGPSQGGKSQGGQGGSQKRLKLSILLPPQSRVGSQTPVPRVVTSRFGKGKKRAMQVPSSDDEE